MARPQSALGPTFAAARRRRWRGLPDLGFQPAMETRFRDYKMERRRGLMSVGLLLAAGMQLAFVFLDRFVLGGYMAWWEAGLLIGLVTVPQTALALLVRTRLSSDSLRRAVPAAVAWGALVICALLAVGPGMRSGLPYAWEATMLLVIFACVFTGLRFSRLFALCMLIFAAFLGLQLLADADYRALTYGAYFLAMAGTLSLTGEYLLERSERFEYLFRLRLNRQIDRDPLTGLSNRRVLYRSLRTVLDLGRRQQRHVAVAMIDVDGFKEYNDRLGHLAGDRHLRRVAAVLRKAAHRPLDCAARFGGDEFCVIWYDVGPDGAERIAERIDELTREAGLAGTLSIGSGVIPPDEFSERGGVNTRTADLVLQYADRQLYRQKLRRSSGAGDA